MDDWEYKAIKIRTGYETYIKQLPKCDKCDKCMFVMDRTEKRVCTEARMIVDKRVRTCPQWCPKII